MATCYKCGTTYYGSICPGCAAAEANEDLAREQQEHAERLAADHAELAERLAERQEAAMQEAAWRMEQASEEAARENRRTVAESWKLQASAKADRALELYSAKMYDEAVALAQQAIEQDPGNLKAYRAASWALLDQGKREAARPYLQKSIDLLRTSDYRSRVDAFRSVLSGIPQDAELHASFSQVFRSAASEWLLDDKKQFIEIVRYFAKHGHRDDSRLLIALAARKQLSASLLALAIDHGFDEEVRVILSNALATNDPCLIESLLPPLVRSDRLAQAKEVFLASKGEGVSLLLAALLRSGRLADAKEVIMASKEKRVSFLLAAFSVEIANQTGEVAGPEPTMACESFASASRWKALKEFGEVESLQGAMFSSATIEKIRLALKERYLLWKEDIESEIAPMSAVRVGNFEIERYGMYASLCCAILAVGCLIASVTLVVAGSMLGEQLGYAGGGLLVVSLSLAWFTRAKRLERDRELLKRQEVEAKHWAAILR